MGLFDFVGDVIGGLTGATAAKQAKQAGKATQKLAAQQQQMYQQANPYYQALQAWLAQNAGLPMGQTPGIAGPLPTAGTVQPQQPGKGFGTATRGQASIGPNLAANRPNAMVNTSLPGGMDAMMPRAGLPNSALGIYGQNPADLYRMQQAEEDVDRMTGQRAKMLQYRLGQQGIGDSGTMASALRQNEQSAMDQLADFRRNLAMNAGQEQERRMMALMGALGPGLSGGQQAAQLQQNMMGMYGNQAAQQQGMLGDALSQFFLAGMLRGNQPQAQANPFTPPFGGRRM